MKKLIVAAILCTTLAACVGPRHVFHPSDAALIPEKGALKIVNPAGRALIIYTPGAADHTSVGNCSPDKPNSGSGIPNVLLDLAGTTIAGKTVTIDGYCSFATGNFQGSTGGVSKAVVRARDIEDLVRFYIAEGVPAGQIFLAGHSMGGWAALEVARAGEVPIGGIIAFAPAHAWQKALRTPNHHTLQRESVDAVSQARRIDGLVFVFRNDPFNDPDDLAPLARVPGIDFVALDDRAIDGADCGRSFAHSMHRAECFRQTQKSRIEQFIDQRLRTAEGR